MTNLKLDIVIARRFAIFLSFWCAMAANVQATDFSNRSQEELAQLATAQEEALSDLGEQLAALELESQAAHVLDPDIANAIKEVKLTYYQAQAQQNKTIAALLKKQEDVFVYQDFASYVLLIVVTIIALAGVVFSAKELNRAIAVPMPEKLTREEKTDKTEPPTAVSGNPTKIKIGFSGIQITSALTGILVLTLSLAFLYLFLQEVYQIKPVRVPNISDSAQS